jgi:hypothetical protein
MLPTAWGEGGQTRGCDTKETSVQRIVCFSKKMIIFGLPLHLCHRYAPAKCDKKFGVLVIFFFN